MILRLFFILCLFNNLVLFGQAGNYKTITMSINDHILVIDYEKLPDNQHINDTTHLTVMSHGEEFFVGFIFCDSAYEIRTKTIPSIGSGYYRTFSLKEIMSLQIISVNSIEIPIPFKMFYEYIDVSYDIKNKRIYLGFTNNPTGLD